MRIPFSFAWVEADETTFNESHVREDESILDLTISQDEGDFATMTIEIENPRVGLLAPGRPLWAWLAWNPNFANDSGDSSSALFDDMVPLFFGRIVGVPQDLDQETVKLTFLARPADFDTQKRALAESLKVLPFFDPIWFSPDTRNEPDNVLESRGALWHIDPITHVVTISSIIAGEDGTIEVEPDNVFEGSISITYGDPPCRRVDVVATVSWDQIATGSIPIVGGGPYTRATQTYTGEGLVSNWPQPAATFGGGWSVGPGSFAKRVDDSGPDLWTWDNSQILQYSFASHGKSVVVPTWAVDTFTGFGTHFPAHVLVLKKWLVAAALAAQYDASRGKSETMFFSLVSDTQSVLTDSTDGQSVELTFSSSEVASPLDVNSSGFFEMPLGKPSARAYLTTDRGQESIEYLLMVARAKLLASARCVDVKLEIPWEFAVSQGVSCRKSLVLSDSSMPGGVAGGKIKHYELTANGDSGLLNCSIVIGCTIGHGGAITAAYGTPTYVEEGYVTKPYQRYDGEFIMPVAGEIAYSPINGLPCNDDGIDFDYMYGSKIFLSPLQITNQAPDQEEFILTADQPDDVYKKLNDNAQTTFSFKMRPVNSGPFATNYVVDTTLLKVPKTIDLEAPIVESSS